MKLFTYGSLKKGFYNHERFNFHKLPFIGEKSLPYWALINLGDYPGMVSGDADESVKGEIYEIDDNGEEYAFLLRVEKGAGFALEMVDGHDAPSKKDYVYAFKYRNYNGNEMKIPGGVWVE